MPGRHPSPFRAAVSRAVPWLLFGGVLMPALATAVVGILVLALWSVPGDIVLGVLTLVFAVFVLAGAFVTLGLALRQNRLARLQAEFVAHVSHELRTPLASIRLSVETLRLGRVADAGEADRFLAAIDAQAERLSGLVERLLEMRAGIEAAHAREAVDPVGAVREAIAPFALHPVDGARIRVEADDGLPRVVVDREAFVTALSNLVRNALTHGGPGPVSVAVRAVPGEVRISVGDEGPGVAPADRERIFERFVRGSTTTDGAVPGLGLGLAIVRDFARSHGGRATVACGPGPGTTFVLRLPAEDAP